MRFLTGLHVTLQEGKRTSRVTIVRAGSFTDARYGRFEITREMLLAMVKNFDDRVYGQDIFIDVSHKPEDGAAAKILGLSVEGSRLRAEVEWTPFGLSALTERGFRYLSADFVDDFQDNEDGERHGPVLKGAALTNRPVIKRLDPVRLSEDYTGAHPTYLHPTLAKTLTEQAENEMKKWLEQLREKLLEMKLAEDVVTGILKAYEKAAEGAGEDEAIHKALSEQFEAMGKTLAETLAGTPAPVTIQVPDTITLAGGNAGIPENDIRRILDEQAQARAAETKQLAETLQARVDQFRRLLDEDKGLKSLTEETRTALYSAQEVITAQMTDDQVRKLAEQQITLGEKISAQAQLQAMGWQQPQGSVRIEGGELNEVKSLQETVDRRMGILEMPDSRRFAATGGQLRDENKALVVKVLAEFDRDNRGRLLDEHKRLAAGDGTISDVAVPAIWERTVIREALYRLVGLMFVDTGTVPFANVANIPYSYRDTTAAGINNLRVYEGQAINRSGMIQTSEEARPLPQKLAFLISNEMQLLTQASQIAWDVVAENARNAVRILGEDTERLIFNEHLQASDEYGATAVTTEDLEPQADGTDTVFILANFPVVRPRLVYDLQGSQVGSTVNPIVISYDSTALEEYGGIPGAQASGTYYQLDYNKGEIALVDEDGVLQIPADTTAYTASYSYATNRYNFDTDLGSLATDVKWDSFLYRYGLRKNVIEDDRYHMANFGLMSGTVMTQIEQAKQFGANARRPGTDLSADGNLGRIKDVPNFKTSAPSLWMGDDRVLVGERGITRLRMMKPWMLGDLEEVKDSNGKFTAERQAYGTQWLALHTPTQLKRAYTSLNLYSAAARVARVGW